MTVATFFELVAEVVTGLASIVTGWLSAIFASGNTLIAVCVLIPFALLGVRIIKRMMSI